MLPSLRLSAFRLSALVLTSAAVMPAGHARPKEAPPLTPEERHLREIIRPLREPAHAPADFAPLHAWLEARDPRAGEREVRRLLDKVHQEVRQDVQQASEIVRLLGRQRARLSGELEREQIRLERAREDYAEFLPVPHAIDLLPGLPELPESKMRDVAPPDTIGDDLADDAGVAAAGLPDVRAEESADTDLDAQGLMNRLTFEITALEHLLHACLDEYEIELKRHKQAKETLTKLLRERRERTRTRAQAYSQTA